MTRLAFPFTPGPDGRSRTVTYASEAQVAQMLELLIMTMIGERVMRPDLGSPVRQMVFQAGNSPAALALEAALQATITLWLGQVLELQGLSVDFAEDEGRLEVVVTYEIRASKTGGRVAVRKDLT
ncbi:GPW/gp25 family protein [Novosphingobium sp.]|uniref:GPW/gp25 family protein n=1 Tax=Novosphingobium sp. TaxID=1874826 RepID=UPI003BAA33D1